VGNIIISSCQGLRDFLKVAGAGVAGLAVGAAAGYYAALPKDIEKPVPQKAS